MNQTVSDYLEEHKKGVIITGVIVGFFLLLAMGIIVLDVMQRDRVYQGILLGGLDVSGLTREEARGVIETWHDGWWANQLVYQVNDERGKELGQVEFFPIVVTEGNGQSYEFVDYDLEAMLDNVVGHGKDRTIFGRTLEQVKLLLQPVRYQATVYVDREKLREVLQNGLSEYETLPEDASIRLVSPYARPQIVSENTGNTFDYDAAIEATVQHALRMQKSVVVMNRRETKAEVSTDDVNAALASFDQYKQSFPLTLNYQDDRVGFERKWLLPWVEASPALVVVKGADGRAHLRLKEEKLQPFLERIENLVNVEAQDAKFNVNAQQVVELFQPSQAGHMVDREDTVTAINDYLAAALVNAETTPGASITVAVETLEPEITTDEVNQLGIKEVLGVGYSNFAGSPSNRVHNIGVGAARLHGRLIAPDEEFSLLNALRPFTTSAGYLPELVIKGDKIEPEIGGGLCQIGSTTFRAAMNSGLPITQRRNHSLVVSYYNDPRNGNPGTDATIYDPAPDFRFKNDTGHYILIQTSMNRQNGDLVFTLWGTSDGRQGSYTEPVVSRWIPTGPTKYVETTNLEPGVEKCQSAHPGAQASFTYSVTKPDGTVEEQVFASSYRALPKICLVGVDPNQPAQEEVIIVPGPEDMPINLNE